MDTDTHDELQRLCVQVDRLAHECAAVARSLIAQGRRVHSRFWWRDSEWERISADHLMACRRTLRCARRIRRKEVSLPIVKIEERCSQANRICRCCHRLNYERYRAKLPFVCRLALSESQKDKWWLDEHGRIHSD